MSSSTSSSRRIYARIFLVITLGMAASMAIIRVITYVNDVSRQTLLGRVIEAQAALPRIVAEEQELVMFFGSSMTDAGFSARVFDRELAASGVDVRSFNFGFGGLNPYFQDFLARRIREAFQESDRRLKLALIEFVPFQLTSARWQGAQPVIDSFAAVLANPQEMWDITLENPTRGIRMLNIRYLRDSVSAEMITWHFGQSLRPPVPTSDLPEDEENSRRVAELSERLGELFEKDYPDWSGENWNYGWQGAGTIPAERSQETLDLFPEFYDALRAPRRLENDRLRRVTCCDIEELHFEEELVEAFIRIVHLFQGFSDHVEVVLLPRNTAWIRYPPEAVARMAAVLERIRAETGVTIRNDQELDGIGPEMFSDTTHLSRYGGDVPYTLRLAEAYAPLLAQAAD